jgi:prephenate dehydratase
MAETREASYAGAGFRHGAQLETINPAPLRGQVEGTKVSLMFRIYDRPGALVDVLTVLSTHGISLTRIESKPSKSA